MTKTEAKDSYNISDLESKFDKMGYQLRYTSETISTMQLAENWAREGDEQPAIFLTDHQIQGVGREGRVWLDKPGASILVSGLLEVREDTIPVFSDLVALYTCRAVMDTTAIDDLRIKYPNDLVIHDQKAGGILVLNIYAGTTYLGTNVGIGINVHYSDWELAEYPTDYGATALDQHTSVSNPRQSLLVAIFGDLKFLPVDAEVFQTNLQRRQDLNNLWRTHSSLLDRTIEVEDGERVISRGKVVNTEIGRGILLETPGQTKWFNQFDTKMKVRLLD